MKKVKRTYHNNEEVLYKRLKLTILAIILIPTLAISMFVFFGPVIGSLFGFVSINRNADLDLDTLAPAIPIFDNPSKATNSNNITIKGFSEAGATIVLYVNGPETANTVTAADGTFTFENIELISGRNTLSAKSIDNSGNESAKTPSLTIEYDTKAPDIAVESPKDGDVVKNLNKRVTIKGSISEKSSIRINDKLAILRPDLSFEFSLGVEKGDNEIKIEAIDPAGNSKTEEFKIIYLQE